MFVEVLITLIFKILTVWLYYYLKSYLQLRKIPAPRVWPLIGNTLEIKNPEKSLNIFANLITKLKAKTVRLHLGFQTVLITADFKLIASILSNPRLVDKRIDYMIPCFGSGIMTSSGEKWRKSRKLVLPGFHYKFLIQFLGVFNANGFHLINKLRHEINNPSIDILSAMTLCALDIILETALGASENKDAIETSEYARCVEELVGIIQKRRFTPFYNFDWIYEKTKLYQQQQRVIKFINDSTASAIKQRCKNLKTERKTATAHGGALIPFVDILLQSTIDGRPLSDDEVFGEVKTFIAAGYDTVAKALSFALFALSNNPDIQRNAFNEIYLIFGDDKERPCTPNDLNKMKYLELVIKEALRMYPPIPMYNRCITENLEYNGAVIPAGTSIMLLTYNIHHDPDYYPDPEKFDPERFRTENCDDMQQFKFIPFSAGHRNCVGQKFSMMEIKCLLSAILRHFEVKPAMPNHTLQLRSMFVLKSLNGVKISLSERKY